MSLIKRADEAFLRKDFAKAMALYAEVLERDPGNAFALFNLGALQTKGSAIASGLSNMEKAIALKPDQAEFRFKLAEKYAEAGQIDNAILNFEAAKDLKPDYGHAYQALTQAKSCENDTHLLASIEHQLELHSVDTKDKCYMHFAAAKICSDRKNYDLAFHHYVEANRLKDVSYNPDDNELYVNKCIAFFDEQWVAKKSEFGLYSKAPVFIIGMPRSGTTLTEQILSGHSDVFGAGEILHIQGILRILKAKREHPAFPELLNEVPDSQLLSLGNSYLKALQNLSNGETYVINKLPQNFLHVGLIALLFPNAKFIHVERNPLDTCLSCFFQHFSTGQEYSFDLKNLGMYFYNYQRLMGHWEAIYPDRIHCISYESLVSDTEDIVRGILKFLDIPWQEQCLSFVDNKRQVTTASKYQVRQPIHTHSTNRWEKYAAHISTLTDILE